MTRIGLLLGVVCLASAAALPARAAPPIEDYGKLPGIEEVQLSPAGTRYAFIATDGEARKLYVASTDSKVLRVTGVGTTKVRGLEWAGDDHVLVTYSATVNLGFGFTVHRTELQSVIVLNVDTGNTFQVFDHQQRKVANAVMGSYGTAQVDGHWYGWFGGRSCDDGHNCHRLQDYPDLYRVDLDTGDSTIAAQGRDDIDGWLVSATGAVAAHALYEEKSGGWWVLPGRNADRVLVQGQNDFGGVGLLNFGRTPDTVLVDAPNPAKPNPATKDAPDGHGFREFPIGRGMSPAGVDTSAMAGPIVDPTTHLWVGQTLRDDEQESSFFAPELQARWRGARKAFPNAIAHLKSWSADFNTLIVFTEGGDDSGTYWLVDIRKHAADPIGSQYPTVTSKDVGPVSMLTYRASDGLELHGVLTLPPGRPAKGLPLVALPHGGPESRDYPAFDWWAQAYASRGYAVFQPNFRGSSGYGTAFRDAGLGEWGRKMQTDISDGVAELVKQGVVDPKRACIVGASYGGYAALAGVTVQQGLYRCAVAVAGVANLSDMLVQVRTESSSPSSSALRYWQAFMGASSPSDSRLDPISPSVQAGRTDAPILLIHGKDDTVVSIEQSETMERALSRAGKPVEFIKMNNEDHWLSREQTRIQMLKAAVAFVEKYNPPN